MSPRTLQELPKSESCPVSYVVRTVELVTVMGHHEANPKEWGQSILNPAMPETRFTL